MEASTYQQTIYGDFEALEGVVDPIALAESALHRERARRDEAEQCLLQTSPTLDFPREIAQLLLQAQQKSPSGGLHLVEAAPADTECEPTAKTKVSDVEVESVPTDVEVAPKTKVSVVATDVKPPKAKRQPARVRPKSAAKLKPAARPKKAVAPVAKKVVVKPKLAPSRKRRKLLHSTPLRMGKPFYNSEAAQAKHPDVFKSKYDDSEEARPTFHEMIKRYSNSSGMANRLQREYGAVATTTAEYDEVVFSGNPLDDFGSKTANYRLLKAHEEVVLAKNIKLGVAAFNKMVASDDFSDPILAAMAREGAYSYQAMFHTNLRLPIQFAKKAAHSYPHVEPLDVLMYAYDGLQRAIEKFDETKGYRFSTYATLWIKQAIHRGLTTEARIIRIPHNIEQKMRTAAIARSSLTKELGRDPTLKELADVTPFNVDQLEFYRSLGPTGTPSLNQEVGEDGGTELGELLESDRPEDKFAERIGEDEELQDLFRAPRLTYNEKVILSIRSGVMVQDLAGTKIEGVPYEKIFDQLSKNGQPGHRTIARVFKGLKEPDVRQIEESAMTKIRQGRKRPELSA